MSVSQEQADEIIKGYQESLEAAQKRIQELEAAYSELRSAIQEVVNAYALGGAGKRPTHSRPSVQKAWDRAFPAFSNTGVVDEH